MTEEGALVETEESVSLDSVPAAVRAAISKHFGVEAKVEVEKTTYIAYEVETKINGMEKSVVVLPTGKIHGEEEHEVDEAAHEDD